MDRERTHWEGCWQERTHHDCAHARIAYINTTAELESQIAARHAERERREAAEALLRGVRTSTIDQLAFEIAPLIDAHFSRYKD